MSTADDKFKHSKRLLKDEAAVKKQVDIAKRNGVPATEPNKFSKRHAMNCGDSNCVMCGNPRKFWGEPTQQEKRLFQDMEKNSDKRSNGKKRDEEDLL